MTRIAIFDYGAGNLFSLKAALERNGAKRVVVIHDLGNLESIDGLVLPGVGNFDPAILSIQRDKELLFKLIDDGIPLLAICLGMEMLFNKSEEGTMEGLNILNGEVIILPKKKVKIPHVGWNNIKIRKKESKLLKDINDGSWVYYVHSYHVSTKNKSMVVASSDYGISIPAVIEKGNLFGTQFHPEKSGDAGGIMVRNFLRVCSEKE